MKAKAGKPEAGRKPGGEGLPYAETAGCVGGPVDGEIKGYGLGEGHEVKGQSGSTTPPRGKGGTSGAKGRRGN